MGTTSIFSHLSKLRNASHIGNLHEKKIGFNFSTWWSDMYTDFEKLFDFFWPVKGVLVLYLNLAFPKQQSR